MRKNRICAANVIFFIAFFLLCPMCNNASAQYFGRNKVQYDQFKFKVIQTPHFDLYYYPSEKVLAESAARMAERWYSRYTKMFRHQFKKRKPIILYADGPDFQQTNTIEGLIGQGTGGVTEPLLDRVIIHFTGVQRENDHVLGHELVHAFQYDIAQSDTNYSVNAMQQLPLWMIEGMAEYFSLGREDAHTAMWMRDAVLHDDFPKFKTMTRYFPYRYGQSLLAYIGGVWGDSTIVKLFELSMLMKSIPMATDSLFQMKPDSLFSDWKKATKDAYFSLTKGDSLTTKPAEKILSEQNMNLAPSLSPDGRYVAFMSERDVFSIDLFLADAHTGRVIRKLASENRNAHFDALSFISSSGSWSPDSKKFAFVTLANGNSQIAIVDVRTTKIEKTLSFDGIGEISNLAWSPDGNVLAFSGLHGGIGDLFLYNFPGDSLRQVTDDLYANLMPAWSPDGSELAFVTDYGSGTDFHLLAGGNTRLAVLDLASGRINYPDLFNLGKQINPLFSPDGNSVFFISDQNGISNIYRTDLNSGEIFRITKVTTGVSGITALSPAMTISRESGQLLFSVFEHGNYHIYSLTTAQTQGDPVNDFQRYKPVAGILPPAMAVETSQVVAYLHDFRTGLPAETTYPSSNRHHKLRLAYIGQPVLGVAVDRYGSYLGGGISGYFSDILGQRVVGASFQSNGGFKEIGGQLIYQNRVHRWNWGAGIAHIPYISRAQMISPYPVDVDGQTYVGTLEEWLRDRVFVDQASILLAYPLSATRRLEANAGVSRIWFNRELESFISLGNRLVSHKKEKLPTPPGINLVQGAVAYVGDYSYSGFTSPTRGGRYRFEIEPTLGHYRYITLLADYRRYFFKRPFTFAFRALHYGRYGKDAEDFYPLFLGYQTFVRGYSSGSFSQLGYSAGLNEPTTSPVYDRLSGSRIAVANVEFRVPVLGTKSYGLINFPYLPTEFSLFLDGGLAWSANEKPILKIKENTNERVPVFSTGISARMNLLGYLIVETYAAYPFQRPGKGWTFGIQIAPGW